MPATEEDRPVMTTQSTVATVDVRIILAGLWTGSRTNGTTTSDDGRKPL